MNPVQYSNNLILDIESVRGASFGGAGVARGDGSMRALTLIDDKGVVGDNGSVGAAAAVRVGVVGGVIASAASTNSISRWRESNNSL